MLLRSQSRIHYATLTEFVSIGVQVITPQFLERIYVDFSHSTEQVGSGHQQAVELHPFVAYSLLHNLGTKYCTLTYRL